MDIYEPETDEIARKQREKLLIDYRQTFNTEHGRRVLQHIGEMCGFYAFRSYSTREEQIAGAVAENLYKKMLYHFGVWDPENFERIPHFYPGNLLDLPMVEHKEIKE